MKFIIEPPEPPKKPRFNDVTVNQFFVNMRGEFCQKYDANSYNVIADASGGLFADRVSGVASTTEIDRIITPTVIKIEF